MAKTDLDLRPVLSFSRALEKNNNREWFQKHRPDYDAARAIFEDYIAAVINELSGTMPLADITPKDCIFRIYRDVRFSKDKSPYKPLMSAFVAPGGRKARRMGLYIHIEPKESMLAGGLYQPEPRQLAAWRASIDRDPEPFKKITRHQTFREYFGRIEGDRLKTAPRGYPKDHPELELLRLKNITVARKISDKEVSSSDFLNETLVTYRAMKPFLDYLEANS